MGKTSSTVISGDLGKQGKSALVSITSAVSSTRHLECVRQVFIQLERARIRAGIENFAYSDIQIIVGQQVPAASEGAPSTQEVA